ncbi:MAG: RNA polymerase sporulation sigma factor SigK [Clostridia bacterium]|nr:RNA polymerase sporulation sigma factor SigK [Clostridia bacterium]
MAFSLLFYTLQNFLCFILHVTGRNSFPKPLSAKEERSLLQKMQLGDRSARNKLIEHNLRLVAHIVKKYLSSAKDQDDLVSIGTIGLIKAVDSFNISKGIRLSSYAARCIDNEVLMHFRSTKKNLQDISMNEPIDIDKDGNTLVLMDLIAIEDSFVDEIDVKLKSEKLYNYINEVLTQRERKIVILRYGLNGRKPLPQREVAQLLGISRSYVSRIEKKALNTLRKRFEKDENKTQT